MAHDQSFDDVRDTDIVVGVDGSAPAKAALRWSVAQARSAGGRVRAVTAWEIPSHAGRATLSMRIARWSSYAARAETQGMR